MNNPDLLHSRMAEYNILLRQHDERADYLDDMTISYDERIKRRPEHVQLCKRLSQLLFAIKNAGVDITGKAVDGFTIDEMHETRIDQDEKDRRHNVHQNGRRFTVTQELV